MTKNLKWNLVLVPLFVLTGCYTQMGGVKDEATPDEESYYSDEYVDSTGGGGQYTYNDDYSRYPYGMTYYYPPYNDPWFFGGRPIHGFGYGYGYYDPFGWDYYGTPYYYGGYYSPAYYGWAYGGGYYHYGGELKNVGTRRTIGNIRATGATRGMESGYVPAGRGTGSSLTLPPGAARRAPTPAAAPRTSSTRPGSFSGSGVDRAGHGRTGSSTGSGSTRSAAPQSRPSGGGSRGSSSRGSGNSGGSSYTPPPPPPPSNSGGSSGGGSDRGSSSSGSSSSGNSSSGSSRGGGSRR